MLPSGALRHSWILELPSILRPADLLVINNTRVFPAKLHGRTESGGLVELLLLQADENNVWQVLARPAKKLRVGTRIVFGKGELRAIVAEVLELGKRNIELVYEGDLYDVLERVGRAPLPPYIKRQSAELNERDRERYQTVYASERGSVAAPTAGLHFTPELLRALAKRDIATAELTLHVGYGTFQPIREETIEDHRMERERYSIPEKTLAAVETARARGGRVVAVGTTTVRALESAALASGELQAGPADTELFITPGFQFRVVDGLLTNFHLPMSSLLLLVSAFGGVAPVRRAYREAIQERYRFYSYGDCMLLYCSS